MPSLTLTSVLQAFHPVVSSSPIIVGPGTGSGRLERASVSAAVATTRLHFLTTSTSGVQPRCSEGLRLCRSKVSGEASHSHGAGDRLEFKISEKTQRKQNRGGALSEHSHEDREVSKRDKRPLMSDKRRS